jgi:hypothetical protein
MTLIQLQLVNIPYFADAKVYKCPNSDKFYTTAKTLKTFLGLTQEELDIHQESRTQAQLLPGIIWANCERKMKPGFKCKKVYGFDFVSTLIAHYKPELFARLSFLNLNYNQLTYIETYSLEMPTGR